MGRGGRVGRVDEGRDKEKEMGKKFFVRSRRRDTRLGLVSWARFFFQAEDGIRNFCLSRGLEDVYKKQVWGCVWRPWSCRALGRAYACLLYTSDAADDRPCGEFGGVSYTNIKLPTNSDVFLSLSTVTFKTQHHNCHSLHPPCQLHTP